MNNLTWYKVLENKEGLDEALKQLFDHSGPALLEVVTDVNLI